MILQEKTLEKLRNLINEETEYRSGPKLVGFFNDEYGQGFPSRWMYTDEKLSKINGTPELDKCIKKLFAPVNFIGRFGDLDKFIVTIQRKYFRIFLTGICGGRGIWIGLGYIWPVVVIRTVRRRRCHGYEWGGVVRKNS